MIICYFTELGQGNLFVDEGAVWPLELSDCVWIVPGTWQED